MPPLCGIGQLGFFCLPFSEAGCDWVMRPSDLLPQCHLTVLGLGRVLLCDEGYI